MMNDSQSMIDATVNDYLSRWHAWMQPQKINGTDHLADPAFREAQSYRGWEPESDVLDADWAKFTMKTIDFIVGGDNKGQGGMEDPYRAAIYILARNCYTGCNVWLSPRLPKDPIQRGMVVAEARRILTSKLMQAGVLFR